MPLEPRCGEVRGLPGISSFHDTRRFWVLASFSLRSGAHVHRYAPLRCSRKPRQIPKLAGRAFLEGLGTAGGVARLAKKTSPGDPCAASLFESELRRENLLDL